MRVVLLIAGLAGCRLGFDPRGAAVDAREIDASPPIPGAVYAIAGNQLFTVVPSTGAATLVGTFDCVAGGAGDLALSRSGELLLVAGQTLYVVDPATARCAERAAVTDTATPLAGLTFVRGATGDELYGGTNARPGKLYRIDTATGVATEIGSYSGGYYSRGDLAVMTGFGLLGTMTQDGGGDWLARIDVATGDATVVGSTDTFYGLVAIDAELFGFASSGSISRIDPQDGTVLGMVTSGPSWAGVALAPPPP